MMTNQTVGSLYERNAQQLGVEFSPDSHLLNSLAGSTDMGNVSHIVPSIHPVFYIGTKATNHTRAFTEAAGNFILSLIK